MTKEELLKQIQPQFLSNILATRPFLPDEALACYVSAPEGQQFESVTCRVLILELAWLHLFEVTYHPPRGQEGGEPVSRFSIHTSDILGVTSRWRAHDTFTDLADDEALEVSYFQAVVTLRQKIGPLGEEFSLPLDERDYPNLARGGSKPAQAFVEALLHVRRGSRNT
jgi:hypothetical protein